MVFPNFVEPCIIQMRQELWPINVFRKITDPLPSLAHWAQIFSVSLESQRGKWMFYPKYNCKLVKDRLFPRDRSYGGQTWAGREGQFLTQSCLSQNRQSPGPVLWCLGLDLQIISHMSSKTQLGSLMHENSTWGHWNRAANCVLRI